MWSVPAGMPLGRGGCEMLTHCTMPSCKPPQKWGRRWHCEYAPLPHCFSTGLALQEHPTLESHQLPSAALRLPAWACLMRSTDPETPTSIMFHGRGPEGDRKKVPRQSGMGRRRTHGSLNWPLPKEGFQLHCGASSAAWSVKAGWGAAQKEVN